MVGFLSIDLFPERGKALLWDWSDEPKQKKKKKSWKQSVKTLFLLYHRNWGISLKDIF